MQNFSGSSQFEAWLHLADLLSLHLQYYMMNMITMIGVKRDDFGFQRPKQVGMSRNNTQNSSLWSLSVKFKNTLETIKTIKPLKSNINVKTQRVSDLFASGVKHKKLYIYNIINV